MANTKPSAEQIIYTPAGTGALATTVEDKLQESVSIFDFMTAVQVAAVKAGTSDASTGLSATIQAAIATNFAANGGEIFFPNGIYFIDAPVIVNFDAENCLNLRGTSAAGFWGSRPGGTRFTSTADTDAMFILTKTNLGTAGAYSLLIQGIDFRSGALETTGPKRVLLNKVAGSPQRPFVVKNCNFVGFVHAIESDLTEARALNAGLTTGICNVVIRENSFVACTTALYGKGGLGSIMNLTFCDNVAENGGGAVWVESPGLGGYFDVSNNLLEGQPDAINISCGLASGQIARNYFEANAGTVINLSASNPASSVVIAGNYGGTLTNVAYSGRYLDISNMQVDLSGEPYNPKAVNVLDNCSIRGFVNSGISAVDRTTRTTANIVLASEAIAVSEPLVGALPAGTTAFFPLVTGTPTGTLLTPFGTYDYHNRASALNSPLLKSRFTHSSIDCAVGQTIVWTFLLEYKNSNEIPPALYFQGLNVGATAIVLDVAVNISPVLGNQKIVLSVFYVNKTAATITFGAGDLFPYGISTATPASGGCNISHGAVYTLNNILADNNPCRILPIIPRK